MASAVAPAFPAESPRVLKSYTAEQVAQLSKDFRVLHENYRRAGSANRPELARQLAQLAEERAAVLKALIATRPDLFLDVTLSEEDVDEAPAIARRHLEHEAILEGVVELDPEGSDAPAGTARYRLRDGRGRLFRLVCVGADPSFVIGATSRIRGVQLDETLVFRAEEAGALTGRRSAGEDGTSPKVAIRRPAHGEAVSATVAIEADVEGRALAHDVSCLTDGTLLGTDGTPPYAFSWDTTKAADGPHQITIRAVDRDWNFGQADVTVSVDHTPPKVVLLAPRNQQAVTGVVEVRVQVTDVIGVDNVTLLVDGAPHAVLVAPPYQFLWDSTTSGNGLHSVEVRATDRARNNAASEPIELRVLNANSPPTLQPIGDQSVREATALTFQVEATDPDGSRDPLTFSASSLPSWATFDPVSRRFAGTPEFSEASIASPNTTYRDVTFQVCDPQPLCDSEQITIVVQDVNRPPVLVPLRNVSVSEGRLLRIDPVVHDPDGDPLTCRADHLPPWLVFDAPTCRMAGTPATGLVSQTELSHVYADLRFEVCDQAGLCVSQGFAVTIENVNQPPRLELIGAQRAEEGRPFRLRVQASDEDQDALTLDASPLPPGADFDDTGTGRAELTWTPGPDQAGTYALLFSVSDGDRSESETVSLSVQERSLSIVGTVRDEFNNPQAGISIEARRADGRRAEAATDSEGRYVVRDLAPGEWTVRAAYDLNTLVPSARRVFFDPLSQRVELRSSDRTGIDFTRYDKQ